MVSEDLPAVAAPVPPVPAPSPAAPRPLTNVQKIQRIAAVIEELRPQFQLDGGDVELVDVDGDTVYVAMSGACMGCQMSGLTISGIQERLMLVLGRPVRVVPASLDKAVGV